MVGNLLGDAYRAVKGSVTIYFAFFDNAMDLSSMWICFVGHLIASDVTASNLGKNH